MKLPIAAAIKCVQAFHLKNPFYLIATKTIIRFRLLTIVALLLLQISCSKSSSTGGNTGVTPPPAQAPVITSVLPLRGPKNASVQISGKGFGNNSSNVKVYFNGNGASISHTEDGVITCTVPQSAGTGVIKVQVGSKETTGPQFTYMYTATVTNLAGSGSNGYADGYGVAAQFGYLYQLTTDPQGNVYVTDYSNSRIRKITPLGVVSTFAGAGDGYLDGPGTVAQFAAPTGICSDAQGNIYVADTYNNMIRKITPQGDVSTVAGGMVNGNADGTGLAAQFYSPGSMCMDLQGNLLVVDFLNYRIRKVTPQGVVSTVAGTSHGYLNGPIATAQLGEMTGICTDAVGNIYVSDVTNNVIRKISTDGIVSTFAGNGQPGNTDGIGTAAQFNLPTGMCFAATGNIFMLDVASASICQINTTTAEVSRTSSSDPLMQFYNPAYLCIDSHGTLFVSDTDHFVVKKVNLD